jgi:voltage-gated potassium channel
MLGLFRSKFAIALSLLVVIYAIGVLGFRFISDMEWVDAMFMTIITITTVGFSTVGELDTASKIFTIFLIITSVFVFAYAISVITEYILSKSTFELLKHKKMQRKIDKLEDHVIVCGYGRNGQQAVQKLITYKKQFVVIDTDAELIKKFESELVPFVNGNANNDDILEMAGIERASCLISALPNDADNLFVVLSARQLNNKLTIISRASEETSYKKLKLAGANNVIMPDRIGGDHMASLVVIPDLIEFIDNLTVIDGGDNTNIEEVAAESLYDVSEPKTIRDLDLRKKTGCTVIGFKKPDGGYLINPEPETLVVAKAKVIVLGRAEQIIRLHKIYNI